MKSNMTEQSYNRIMEEVTEVGCEKKKCFYLFLLPKYNDLRKELMDELKNCPVIRSRVSMLGDIKTTKNLKGLIDKYVQRITWHLYRMYRTRNAIIHSGEISANIKYLGEHLHSYVDSTVTEFIAKLSGDIPFESVENVMVDIKFAVDNLENAITKERDIDEKIVNILIHPEMGAVMHCEEHIEEMLSIE